MTHVSVTSRVGTHAPPHPHPHPHAPTWRLAKVAIAPRWSCTPSDSPLAHCNDSAAFLPGVGNLETANWRQIEPEAECTTRASLEGTEDPVAHLRPLAKPRLRPQSGDPRLLDPVTKCTQVTLRRPAEGPQVQSGSWRVEAPSLDETPLPELQTALTGTCLYLHGVRAFLAPALHLPHRRRVV